MDHGPASSCFTGLLPDGAACAKFARAASGKMDYTAAAGVDAGLLVARKREDVKNVRD